VIRPSYAYILCANNGLVGDMSLLYRVKSNSDTYLRCRIYSFVSDLSFLYIPTVSHM